MGFSDGWRAWFPAVLGVSVIAATPAIARAPNVVVVSLQSEPSGAQIVRDFDNCKLGTTPAKLSRPAMPGGKRSYIIKLEGHEEARVIIPADRDADVKVKLKPTKKPDPPKSPPKETPKEPPKKAAARPR